MSDEPADQLSLELSNAAFVRVNTAGLMRFALTKCDTREEAEDCVAETFEKIWKVWPDKHQEITDRGIAYAMTVLKNTTIDRHRSRARRVRECELEERHIAGTPSLDDIEKSHLFGEFQRELWAAVGTLPETQQQLLHLVYVEEYKVAAAARVLGLSTTTAANYHKYALATLKTLIAGPDEE